MSAVDDFVALSETLTAFTEFQLRGTGLADGYLATVTDVVGADVVGELLTAYQAASIDAVGADGIRDPDAFARAIRHRLLSDQKLGPIARNVIKLWYVGLWFALPPDWSEVYGARPLDTTFAPEAAGYPEGLLWKAIGANPPGARAPGYGSWAKPPLIDARYWKGPGS